MPRTWLAILAAVFTWVAAAAGPFTYDTNNQGWQQTTVGQYGLGYESLAPNSPAGWTPAEGLPPGSIYQSAGDTAQNRAYWMGLNAAPMVLGDLHGQSLSTSIYSFGSWRNHAGRPVIARWVIARQVTPTTWNMWVSKASAGVDLNSFSGWRQASVELEAANFFKWPNGPAPGTFDDVLGDYDSLGMYVFSDSDTLSNYNGGAGTWGPGWVLNHYGAWAAGRTATWGLDNFGVVPEPGTLLLVAGGLVALRRRRR